MTDIISAEAAWKDRALKAEAQHEATEQKLHDFRQEVSDVIEGYLNSNYCLPREPISRFIIPAPKPDPLVDILAELNWITAEARFRAALDARGLQIVEKGQ